MLTPVILAGGAGTRLWPVSRLTHPKPFMVLKDGLSLLQKTLLRTTALAGVKKVLTITNRDYYFKTRDEYNALGSNIAATFDYLLEPVGKNTAPAIAMAAVRVIETEGPNAIMLVMPADHLIEDEQAFAAAVNRAQNLAIEDYLVTFGVRPSHPDTGFGYIEIGAPIGEHGFSVRRFIEKPTLRDAEAYLAEGGFFWNSGMFCLKASRCLDALKCYSPDVYTACLECRDRTNWTAQPVELDAASFSAMPDISIDYAVMEKANRVAMTPGDFGWNDIGSWKAVSSLTAPDEFGNRIDGNAVLIDTLNCYIQSDRLVAAIGLKDIVLVDTPDALLIADIERTQDVKEVVWRLKRANHETYRLHRTVHRPWGTYTVLEKGDRFKIKRIVVKPGAALSLQMHHHRNEHWIVVSGTAKVINGKDEKLVRVNESTYIPAGNCHRLINPGVIDLVMIEVQSGEYLEEDDIIRFDDQYGRN
ncbi:MAG: mannose-1-phosphate guanylyltransferase/mannose-6-phosphate isomerase [Dissulfurimicrobium sp.]|uniref:mannose-1-phosphate guanylyltransferase/mannose-6-phosphate isomerase n=1 Tax=Dissulfurimicrobium sp. TaxID=2022436 RepID=UPI00404AA674